LQRYLKEAKLKLDACVEDIDYKTPRGIDQFPEGTAAIAK
jgi:hypothetical protein